MKQFLRINLIVSVICIAITAVFFHASASDIKNRTPQLQKRLALPEPKLPVLEKKSEPERKPIDGKFNLEAQLLYDYLRETAGLSDEAAIDMLRSGDVPTDRVVRY